MQILPGKRSIRKMCMDINIMQEIIPPEKHYLQSESC